MLLGHPQQICGHGRRSQKLILEELTLVPTRRAREECYDGSRAKPTHGCTSSFTKDKCYTFQSRPLSLYVPGDKEKCVEQVDKLGEEVPPGEGKDTQRVGGV